MKGSFSLFFITLSLMSFFYIAACNDDSSSDGDDIVPVAGGMCSLNGTIVTIKTNHGHTMTVTAQQVIDGVEEIYNIQGSAGHTHTVTVTAVNFGTLNGNMGIQVTSSINSGHDHNIVINCN